MKKTVYAILACIILAGIAFTIFMGLNFDIRYTANTQIDIYIGKQFNNEDIKQIVKEVLEDSNAKVIVQKVEVYEDMVSITVENITDEQLETLNNKINEKYELENKVEDIEITNNAKLRGRDLVKPYIWPVVISMVIILIYTCIMYRNLGILKVIAKVVGFNIMTQLVYLGIMAITRLPVTNVTVPIALVIYVATLIGTTYKLNKDSNKITEKNKKNSK